jgi:hypothetical protein
MMRTPSDGSSRARLREHVLQALELFWAPLSPMNELGPYLTSLYGQAVTANEFEMLLNDEREAFSRGLQHDVWLCLGLRPDQTADPDRWARSDWPLWVRVVAPESEEIRIYWLLRQLYRAPVMPGPPGTQPLEELWTRLATRLPTEEVIGLRRAVEQDQGHEVDWTEDRYSIWAETAEGLFDRLATQDRQRRQQLADKFSLDTYSQLFGVDG